MGDAAQRTLRSFVVFSGVGLHSGREVRMEIHPAAANHGIRFERTDLSEGDTEVPARWDAVVPSRLTTLVANSAGVSIATTEHLMAALFGCNIHNALVRIDGPEVPIMDGSAAPFVADILKAGSVELEDQLRIIRIIEPVEVREGDAIARIEPHDSFEIEFSIDFADAAIGRQERRLDFSDGAFNRELADSRTFVRLADIEVMKEKGLALGGTMENAVVFDGDRILTPSGLRHSDEPVRHKMLDAFGDLALAGHPILGRFVGKKSGHALTNRLLRSLFATPSAYRFEEVTASTQLLMNDGPIAPVFVAPSIPAPLPAPLQLEVSGGSLVKAKWREPRLPDERADERARLGWEVLRDFKNDFLSSVNVGNYRPLAATIGALTRALGASYEDMNEVGVGISGQRLKALSQDTDLVASLPEGSAVELETLSMVVATFANRFPRWRAYLQDAADTYPIADLIQEEMSLFEGIAHDIEGSLEVDREVVNEFREEVVRVQENPGSEIAAYELLASTREIIRALADDAVLAWALYRETFQSSLKSVSGRVISESKQIRDVAPTELRKAGFWGGLGLTWDLLFLRGAGLNALASKFPETLWWVKDLLRFFGFV